MSNANIAAALKSGAVTAAKVDDSAKRVLTPLFAVGAFDKPNPGTSDLNVTTPEHNTLSRDIAAAATVLLQNEGAVLPLNVKKGVKSNGAPLTIAVVGKEAMGLTVHGGGSGHVDPVGGCLTLFSLRVLFASACLCASCVPCASYTCVSGGPW